MEMSVHVGAKFESFNSLEEAVKAYEQETNVTLWKREARTIKSMSKRISRLNADAENSLTYYSIKYACVFGGRTHKKQITTGTRPSTTFRQGCSAHIKVLLSADQKFLEITAVNTDHNHLISEELNKSLPKQRKLAEEDKQKVNKLMNLQVNKKLLQQEIQKETGKLVTLRDLSNIAAKYKGAEKSFNEIIDTLKQKYKCSVAVLHDNEKVLQGLFWQDPDMKRDFCNFPEMLFFDGTYKLLDINFTCYVFLVVDGNDNSEIVGIGLLSSETKESMQWLLQQFKNLNMDSWPKVRAVMTDKDLTERQVFKEEFPEAQLLICLFHTFRSFKREITTEKMKISSNDIQTIKEYLTKLAYCQNEEAYKEIYEKFSENAPLSVRQYYDKNWHTIRMEWTHMNCVTGNFGNSTNNKLENINGKMKSVIQRYSSLPKFIDGFFALLNCLRQERNHKAAYVMQRRPVNQFEPGTTEFAYNNYLLPHPFKQLLKQILKSKNNQITSNDGDGFVFMQDGKKYVVSPLACSCAFFKSMRLPCCHILSVKSKLGIDLFDPELCDQRWTRENYTSVQRIYDPVSISETSAHVKESSQSVPKSVNGKFKRIQNLASKLADVASLSSPEVFREQEAVLKQILSMWEQGKKATVVSSDDLERVVSIENNHSDHSYTRNFPVITGDMVQQRVMDTDDFEIETSQVIEVPCITNVLHDHLPDNPETQTFLSIEEDPCSSNVYHAAETDVDYPETQTLLPIAEEASNSYVSPVAESAPVEDILITSSQDMNSIHIPKSVKRKGRARGFGSTAIGLKRRKTNSPIAFVNLPLLTRQLIIIGWFTSEEKAKEAVKNEIQIEEHLIEVIPANIPNSCLDECVNLDIVKHFFTEDGWNLLQQVVLMKKETVVWSCNSCNLECGTTPTVLCNRCLNWIHYSCAGLIKKPRTKFWFCRKCAAL